MPFDPSAITLDVLRKKNPERTQWEGIWPDYQLSYAGGYQFLRAAGELAVASNQTVSASNGASSAIPALNAYNTPRRRFLRQLEGEPNAVYQAIWEKAEYVNYLSGILDYHRHWLFSNPPAIRPTEGEDPPDWFEDFHGDATGSGTSLLDFIRDVFLDVLVCRRSGWMVRQDNDDEQAAVLKQYRASEILDWEHDTEGELLWVVLSKIETRRDFPNERKQIEIYTYADRTQWLEWEVVKDEKGGERLKLIDGAPHGLECVPFVMIEIPHGLWITDKLFSWQIGLFNQWTRLKSAMQNGCIVQPYKLTVEPTQSGVFGEGIIINLRPGVDGKSGNEDFGWKSPDVSPLEFIWNHFKETRDEGYRIVHQMALAVDSKSIGAIARSGASKIEDRKASEIILAAYGGYVRDAILRTLYIMSEVNGDDTEWVCDGFDNFQISTLDEELQISALASTMNFKSKTAKMRLELKILGRLLDNEDEKTREVIAKETEDAYEQEAEAQSVLPYPQGTAPPIPPPDPKNDGEGDAGPKGENLSPQMNEKSAA